MICIRTRTTLSAAIGAVLCLLTASCIGSGSTGDDEAEVATTVAEEPETTDSDADDTTTTMSPSTGFAVADLTDVAWVVNDIDGLVDDRGRVLAAPPTGTSEVPRPSVARAVDGSIHYVLAGRLWRQAVDAAEPEEVDADVDEIPGVVRNDEGDITRMNDVITASNGITVRVLPPDADVDDDGSITAFRSPARLEVERNGVVEWTIDAGGVAAPWLSLVDFNGRFVMMARYPIEPADPMAQHIVYDLDCPTSAADGEGCTRTFQARWGTAALVGPDRSPGDDDLNTVLLDLCPTMGALIEPPVEMTDPASFDEDFTDDDLDAFQLAALHLTTCDPVGVGDPEQPGLLYVPGGDDPAQDGWMWTEFAQALRGPFMRGAANTFVWSRHPDGPFGILDRNFSAPRLHLEPGRRYADDLAVTVTAESVLVSGHTDAATAETVAAAARSAAEDRGARFSDRIDPTATAQPEALVDEFLATMEAEIQGELQIEIHLTADGVVSSQQQTAVPTTAQRDLGFLMADFASGGEGVYAELPLANDVLVALGSQVVARRQRSELFRRSAWTVNSEDFAGRVGPVNVLDMVPSPSEVVVGPHSRCAGPEAVPSPPELVPYRRIGILPLEGSIDSCLEWSAVDIFVDDDGVIQGIALHLEEP